MNSDLLSRAVSQILPDVKSLGDLISNRKIKVYYGIDPSTPNIHIGHVVPLLKLRDFQAQGHQVVFLIGSFTAMIGDPTDKTSARVALSAKQVEENMNSFLQQANKIIDIDKVEVVYNGDWYSKMSLSDYMEILQKLTLQRIEERDFFKVRREEKKPIYMHELMYPILQGYDSVMLDVDLEIGGTDQMFNMMVGRDLQKVYNNREKWVLTTPLIAGLDGQKMSKSAANAINVQDSPADMFAKIMSISDDLIAGYYENLTRIPLDEIEEIKAAISNGDNPMSYKLKLATEITTLFYSATDAALAGERFFKIVQSKEFPDDALVVHLSELSECTSLLSAIVEICRISGQEISNSELRRLISQNAIEINSNTIEMNHIQSNYEELIGENAQIKIGKRIFIKVTK